MADAMDERRELSGVVRVASELVGALGDERVQQEERAQAEPPLEPEPVLAFLGLDLDGQIQVEVFDLDQRQFLG